MRFEPQMAHTPHAARRTYPSEATGSVSSMTIPSVSADIDNFLDELVLLQAAGLHKCSAMPPTTEERG